jgi:hypothetical protein
MEADDIQSHKTISFMVIGQVRKALQKISFYLSLLTHETHTFQLAETAQYHYCSTQPKISGPTSILTSEWHCSTCSHEFLINYLQTLIFLAAKITESGALAKC